MVEVGGLDEVKGVTPSDDIGDCAKVVVVSAICFEKDPGQWNCRGEGVGARVTSPIPNESQ